MKKYLILIVIAATAFSSQYTTTYLHEIRDYSIEERINLLFDEAVRIQLSQKTDAQTLATHMYNLAEKSENQKLISDALYNLGYIHYRWYQNDSAKYYLRQSLEIRKELNYSFGIGESLNRLGNVLWNENKRDSAIVLYKKALAIHEQFDHYKEAGMASNNLGNSYRQQQNYQRALEYFIKASNYYEKSKFSEGLAWLHYSMALFYKRMSEYDKALEYSTKALDTYSGISTTEDSNGIMICYNQLGSIYLNMEEYDKSLEYQLKALRLRKKTGLNIAIADGMMSIGMTYYTIGEIDKAKKFFSESITLREKDNQYRGQATSLQHLAKINLIQGDTIRAEKLFNDALIYANKTGELITKSIVLKALTSIYYNKGDIDKAFTTNLKYSSLQDSLHKQAMSDEVAMMKLNYELREKDRENNYLSQQNVIKNLQIEKNIAERRYYNALMISSVIVMITLLLLYNKIHHQNKNLKESLNNIKTLKGLIPICSNCKKIRNDQGFYEHLDLYLQQHTDAELSHGICPECMEKLYGGETWYKKNITKPE